MPIAFSKMHGLGNDFVVIYADKAQALPTKQQVCAMADRKRGVGFDQLLWLSPPRMADADFSLKIFNADGSTAEQCGNGLRCIGRYIQDQKLSQANRWLVDTDGGVCDIWHHHDDSFGANLGCPVLDPQAIPLQADGPAFLYRFESPWGDLELGVVSMGNPHAVLRVDDLGADDLEEKVRFIASHQRLPNSANIGVCVVDAAGHIRLRVFERGAGWTDACGTGAAASVVVARLNAWLAADVVTVTQPGGDLQVRWQGERHAVAIIGATAHVFDATWLLL